MFAIEPHCLYSSLVVDFIQALQLGKMVPATNGAKRALVASGGEVESLDRLAPAIVQWLVDAAQLFVQFVQTRFPGSNAGVPQRHAASDVVANKRRIEPANGKEGGSDRVTASGVQAPENWRGYQLEGLMAVKQVRNERAVEWLRKAAEANPDAGDTHLLLGLALFRSGQQAAAREELLAGLRKPHRRESQEMATETLALIEEALGLNSNVPGTSKSALTAAMYHNLGVSFLYGPQPNYNEAAKWLRKAAEMGDSQAQGTLGVLYWNGRGVPQDPVIAVGWLRKAADSGEAQAMRNLGKAYDQGLGIEKDQNEAMRWMRRAAEAGDAQAQAILGKACYECWNTPKNLVEALVFAADKPLTVLRLLSSRASVT